MRQRAVLACTAAAVAVTAAAAGPTGALAGDDGHRGHKRHGFRTAQPPMLAAVKAGVRITPLLTVGDTLANGYRFEAIPDGIAVAKRKHGRVDLYVNHETAKVPYGRLRDVVRSYEWTRLEPNVVSLKLYAPHLGIVMEKDVAGGSEFMQLVAKHQH